MHMSGSVHGLDRVFRSQSPTSKSSFCIFVQVPLSKSGEHFVQIDTSCCHRVYTLLICTYKVYHTNFDSSFAHYSIIRKPLKHLRNLRINNLNIRPIEILHMSFFRISIFHAHYNRKADLFPESANIMYLFSFTACAQTRQPAGT